MCMCVCVNPEQSGHYFNSLLMIYIYIFILFFCEGRQAIFVSVRQEKKKKEEFSPMCPALKRDALAVI